MYFTLLYGFISSIALSILYFILLTVIDNQSLTNSIFFLCFSTYMLIISYSFKNIEHSLFNYPLFDNTLLNGANIIGFLLIAGSVYTPIGQHVLSLTYVPFMYIWIVITWMVTNIALVECMKYMYFIRKNK